ncbi:GSCFA family protein [Balneicella halophila]|uniref:GSCFA family protein n=1 Tax=Balneicella halophila TaxID=1537566 RepID=A0A7L4UT45_BALHA|nr:GSCFA domain-containing protein [Balneicella halophila]PVX52224.1 GSCFA family protein [Balneicella halophila]
MNLQTTVDIQQPKSRISHLDSLLFIGSCFAENIGNKTLAYKFKTVINPCGIAYNPISATNTIALISKNKCLKENDFVFNDDLWHSLHHHGRFSQQELDKTKTLIAEEIKQGYNQIVVASHIFLTLGTSWVFEHIATEQVVTNCHKLPAKHFRRRKLSIQEVTNALQTAIHQIRELNSTAEIIFTVSPVRHLKDGLHKNQLSKATLLLGIEKLQQVDKTIGYFPAYEIAMDELRDYRFYAQDFTHLNELGTNYIWERFCETYIKKESQALFPALEKLHKALHHRAINKETSAYQKFKAKVLSQIESLEYKLPFINFTKEKEQLN